MQLAKLPPSQSKLTDRPLHVQFYQPRLGRRPETRSPDRPAVGFFFQDPNRNGTLASIGNDPGGRKRILFYAPCGARKTIRLGKCSKSNAQDWKSLSEKLLTALITGYMDRKLANDVEGLHPTMRAKFEDVGLLEPLEPLEPDPVDDPGSMTLDAFLTDYMDRHGPAKKPATRIVWGQVMAMLRKYMPAGITLSEITVGHAKAFHQSLQERGLASSTVYKRIGFARQFFEDAVDFEQIPANPFAKVKARQSSKKSNVNVPMETVAKVLKHCDPTWQTIVALSRLGGLRTPSETLSLKWGDVDFENDRMRVPEPKVEHHEDRGVRDVPIFVELRPYLEAAFKAASAAGQYPSPESYVVDKQAYRDAAMTENGWANANLRTQFAKILKRAGVDPWARLFHSMRASRETELLRDHPQHVVCAWLGNTAAVADKHYLLVTNEDFDRASNGGEERGTKSGTIDPKNGPSAARNPAPQPARNEHARNEKSPSFPVSNDLKHGKNGLELMEVDGLEPLHDSPCLSDIDASAARNPARSDPETANALPPDDTAIEAAILEALASLPVRQQRILRAYAEALAAEAAATAEAANAAEVSQ